MNDIKQRPLVSIIVITYNSSRFVLETLESAKSQSYQNIELIVSDDCSTDNTVEICRNWIAENEDRFERTELITVPENTGIPANCNRGVMAVHGKWVKFIAGDDAMMNDYIEKCVNYVITNKNVFFLYTNIERYNSSFEKSNLISSYDNILNRKINLNNITAKEQFEILLRSNSILAISFFGKREAFIEVGLYNEKYTLFEDWPMWLNITKKGFKIYFYDFVGVKYRLHPMSIQRKKQKQSILINDFRRQSSEMILNEYLEYYSFVERICVFWINKITLLFAHNKVLNINCFVTDLFLRSITKPANIVMNIYRKKYI